MNAVHRLSVGLSILLAAMCLGALPLARAASSTTVKPLFANPPREYATAPLWVWNDLLTEQQIRDTLRDLAGQQVKQAFVHPRPGLMTPYLSDDWFRLWKVALDEAARLDMNIWIYDENSYPSGFAGGWVPEVMPESRGMGLVIRDSKTAPAWNENLVTVHGLEGDRAVDFTARVKAGETLPEGRYLVASIQRAGNSPWHGNRCYVNLLTPGVTEKFIEVTLEAYKRELGDHFGQRVPGVFTDEPNIRPAGSFPWCLDLPEQFQKRWGYNLLDHLPSLQLEVGEWRRVRHNYFCLLNELFIERWGKPMYEWCDRNGLDFTGHYWDHEWPHCAGVPDNMAMAAWQHRPGVDTLMNQYAEHNHAQFGNVRYCREVSSIANQLGRERTLVEIYGAGGWDLRFEDMKRIGDWLAVLGVNTFDEHLSYVTLRGARKRDHPQSFSYHEPWWDAYHVNAQYLARLSAAMSQGEQINKLLVLHPTTTVWMYQGDEPKLREVGDAFFNLLLALEAAQIEYDLGCEDVIARVGKVVTGDRGIPALRVGARTYDRIVLPPHNENLNRATVALLEQALPGVAVWSLGAPPTRVDGAASEAFAALAKRFPAYCLQIEPAHAVASLAGIQGVREGFRIDRAPQDRGILFHHRRHLDDGELLLLVNTSIEAASRGSVFTTRRGVEEWNLRTGTCRPLAARPANGGITVDFELPPSGSQLLFLSPEPNDASKSSPAQSQPRTTLAATAPPEIHRLEPNVLTLDYVDITAGGETRANQYFYPANQFAWQKNGMARNPWDSAVQFQDELIAKTFPADSGFEASYRFTVEGSVPDNLEIVLERPDLYTITCNGTAVAAEVTSKEPGQPAPAGTQAVAFKHWWLDRAFGRIPLAHAARTGDNVVTLQARPFTMFHELEPAYLRGDFSLKPGPRGFVVAPDQPLTIGTAQPVTAHSNHPDGTMWLSGGIGFSPGVDDRAPFVLFDLGQPTDLTAVEIWNYCEGHVRDLTSRGTKTLRLSTGPAPDALSAGGTFELPRATGPARSQELPLKAAGVRYVKLECLANHAGVTFPATGEPPDNGLVGLAEVVFRAGEDQPLKGVTVQQASSELGSHRRQAKHLVDGSGLAGARPGWNEQGHPFYAHGVAYRQSFTLPPTRGRYVVSLPAWYGSVARVKVNHDLAGYLSAPPWELEVTPSVRAGDNTIEVVVFGTLKNTLGPHHGGHALGSAWPSMFQNGPKDGPPPGDQYATVGYGLFEPFRLERLESVNLRSETPPR
jgi:hypothetical protein